MKQNFFAYVSDDNMTVLSSSFDILIYAQGVFPARSVGSPLSAGSLKNCSGKASLDGQPSVLRIDDSLSPVSFDSVVVAERDTKSEKYASASPMNSPACLGADQVLSRLC